MATERGIALEDVKYLSRSQSLRIGGQLAQAANGSPTLRAELPKVAQAYGSALKAARRLLKVGGITRERTDYAAFVVTEGSKAVGMATLQVHDPIPNPRHYRDNSGEISYWVTMPDRAEAAEIGKLIVPQLVGHRHLIQRPANGWEHAWMVTLPDDDVKTPVMLDLGYRTDQDPRVYDLDDGVTEPRLLWDRPL